MDSEGTQLYIHMYLFSPKLLSYPGCQISKEVTDVGHEEEENQGLQFWRTASHFVDKFPKTCLFLASLFDSVNPEGDRSGVASSMLWIE